MSKLVRKTEQHYSGKVHDLHIADSHTYNVHGKAVHNSGAGSLVNYLLNITTVDPLKYGLLFARFLSPVRDGMPDVDSDVSDNDLLKQLLRDEFGESNVIPISNYNTLSLKSLIKDVSKFYSIPFDDVNMVTKGLENEVRKATIKPGDDKNVFVLHYADALKHSENLRAFIETYPQVGAHIENLFEQNKAIGRHAGGVIIGDDIHKRMPIIRIRGEKQSAWVEGLHYRHLEDCGIIKYDLLGLKTLRIIERAIYLILKRSWTRHGGRYAIHVGDSKLNLMGDQNVITRNRGTITAKELTRDDDIIEVPGMWKEA